MSFEVVGVRLVAEGGPEYFSTMAKADKAVMGFGDVTGRSFKQMPGLADIAVGAFHRIGAATVDMFAKAGRAGFDFVKGSINVAGDFEAGMADVSIAIGDSLDGTGLKLEDFRKDFLQIGKELPVSTSEVQDAAIELIKGGIDPLALHMGGLKESIQFATAAGIELTDAAELSARQLGIWTDTSATAEEQAKFLAMSHELLVKAAGASTVGVDDLAKGMNIAGAQAKALNLDYKDFTITMAQIAPAFNSTEEAGTSYKNFLARLQPSTKPAIAALKTLNLWTEENGSAFFDATGKYVGNRQAAELLQSATSGLTDAQRAQMLQTIFGNDAMGTAIRLATTGAEGYDTMAAKMDKASGVAAAAAEKQKGFKTALDNAKGSVETLQIILGTKLMPTLTNVLNQGVAPMVNMLSDLVDVGYITSQTFDGLPPKMQGVASVITDSIAAIQGAFDAVQKKIGTVQEVIRLWDSGVVSHKTLLEALGLSDETAGMIDTMIGKVGELSAPVLDFIGTVQGAFSDGGIVGAVQTVIDKLAEVSPGFAILKGAAEAAFPAIESIVTDTFGIITDVIDEHGATMLADVQGVWDGIWDIVKGVLPPIQKIVGEVFGFVAEFIHEHGDEITAFLKKTWDQVFEIINTALALIKGILVPVLTFIGDFIEGHGDEIGAAMKAAWEIITASIDFALTAIGGILKTALKIIQGDWQGAWETIKETGQRLTDDINRVISSGLDLLKETFNLAIDAILGIWDGLVGKSAGIGNDIIHGVLEGVRNAQNQLYDLLSDIASDALQAAKDAIGIGSPSKDFADQMGRPIVQGIEMGIEQQLPSLLDQVGSIGRQIGAQMSKAMGGIGDLSGGLSLGGGGSGLSRGITNPLYAAMRGGSITNYNAPVGQRTTSLTYNTAVAPPVNHSLAIASALAGGS